MRKIEHMMTESVDFEIEAMMSGNLKDMSHKNRERVWREFISKPLQKINELVDAVNELKSWSHAHGTSDLKQNQEPERKEREWCNHWKHERNIYGQWIWYPQGFQWENYTPDECPYCKAKRPVEKPAKKECCPDCGLEDCVHWELDKCKEKKDELAEVKLPEYHHPCLLCRKWAVEVVEKVAGNEDYDDEDALVFLIKARLKESK